MSLILELKAIAGSDIKDVAKQAIDTANKIGVTVNINFKGIDLLIFENNNVGEVIDQYKRDIRIRKNRNPKP